jgi:hypothetical protein
MKTAELSGAALDWAVAHAQGLDYEIADGTVVTGAKRYEANNSNDYYGCEFEEVYEPSTDWAQGGAIIEREWISTFINGDDKWVASDGIKAAVADTPLIAAMRCYVSSKLGDEVELPEELEVTA